MSEPTRLLATSADLFFQQSAPSAGFPGFIVIFNGVLYGYKFSDKAAAKTYWATQSGFVNWWDMSAGASIANTTTSGGSARAIRPSDALVRSLGGLSFWYCMNEMQQFGVDYIHPGAISKFPQVGVPAQTMAAYPGLTGAIPLAQIPGHYDYALQGSRRIDKHGIAYPTGALWTISKQAWFTKTALDGAGFDLFWINNGLPNEFELWVNGADGHLYCGGYNGTSYLFPENEGPPYVRDLGQYPLDLNPHHVLMTLTNDSTGVAGGLLNLWIDGAHVVVNVQGRHGQYFGDSTRYYEFCGSYEGTAGAQTVAVADWAEWWVDVSSLVAQLAA